MKPDLEKKPTLIPGDPLGARPVVLIVDDEEPICSSLADVLQDEGFETATASNGSEALEKISIIRPEVVFLDIWMPGRDGIETLEQIKEISPNTEVIMISGHASIANALEATKRGAFDFIEKPLDIESIILSATRAVQRYRRGRANKSPSPVQEVEDILSAPQPLLSHPGVLSKGLAGNNIGQRTLRKSSVLYGKGLHSGEKSGLILEPLPLNSGIHFSRIGDSKAVPAFVDFVESTSFATTIRSGSSSSSTIEHLLAAFHSYRISNLLVKCNAEVPILDGSAVEFCKLIESVGLEEQGGEWFEIAPEETIQIESNETESMTIEPAECFSVSYDLNYPPPVGKQYYEFTLDSVERFKNEIAPARTFGFMKDVEALQRAGLAAGGSLDNNILIGPDGIVNTELRFTEELARHKILDILGDLFLLGRPLRVKITARMTGHSDNVQVINALRKLI